MSKEWDPETVFDVLSCEYARGILVAAARSPRSAQELAECCETSHPTIYRRLGVLEEYGFIDVELQYDDDGNHYKTFETTLEELTVTVDNSGVSIDDTSSQDLPSKFQLFWNDLERGDPTGHLEHLVDLPDSSSPGSSQDVNSDG